MDVKKLKEEIKCTAVEIKKLKVQIRGKSMASGGEWYDLRMLKEKATVFCSIRAHHRNRIHHSGYTLDQQAEYIKKHAPEFDIEWQEPVEEKPGFIAKLISRIAS